MVGIGAAAIVAASVWGLRRAAEPARPSQIAGRAILAMLAAITTGRLAGNAPALLPAFELGLLIGLWFALSPFARSARLAIGLGMLALSQFLPVTAMGQTGESVWSLAIPIALAWLLFRAQPSRAGSYGGFWEGVGASFPDLGGAASTTFYRENEIRLISTALGDLRGRRILKTDLWDEARNTRIMQWASAQGGDIFGIDISPPTLRMARDQFEPGALKAALADVRRLPFAGASFDAVYSMGTIEHFDESEAAVAEMARVLKPGGLVILGVPNRFDPFLRPVMVWILWCLGLYGYGFEKSYSRPALRRMITHAGFEVVDETGILFIPGWLRIADLVAQTRLPLLAPLTTVAVRLFVWVDARVPGARRHGYLLAVVGARRGPQPAIPADA